MELLLNQIRSSRVTLLVIAILQKINSYHEPLSDLIAGLDHGTNEGEMLWIVFLVSAIFSIILVERIFLWVLSILTGGSSKHFNSLATRMLTFLLATIVAAGYTLLDSYETTTHATLLLAPFRLSFIAAVALCAIIPIALVLKALVRIGSLLVSKLEPEAPVKIHVHNYMPENKQIDVVNPK